MAAFETILNSASVGGTLELRRAAFGALIGKSQILFEQGREDLASAAIEQSWRYIRPDDPASLRGLAATLLEGCGRDFARTGKNETAIAIWDQASKYIRPGDSRALRHAAASALEARGHALAKLGKHEEAHVDWAQVPDYVDADDPEEHRRIAFWALGSLGEVLFLSQRHEDASVVWLQASEFVRPDDALEVRQPLSRLLAALGRMLGQMEVYRESIAACKRATVLDPSHAEAWRSLAEVILERDDDAEIPEAEDAARRAVGLAPDNAAVSRVLANVLLRRGNWAEALQVVARTLENRGDEFENQNWPGLTESLIRVVAGGHENRVRQLMEKAGLREPLEPLWHAVRAELGEELEPLPAEVMGSVTDIRKRIAAGR